jgi:GT2 family glycosyltransferase
MITPPTTPQFGSAGSNSAHSVSSPTVSVIICAYTLQRWDDIRSAIDSVLIQTVAPHEILLVIDHNAELLERAREAFPSSLVRVLANDEQRGLSGGRNTGVKAAGGEVVAFLDDDAAAEIDWIERLGRHYENPNVFGAGGHASPLWPEQRPSWLPREFDWVVGCSYTGQPTELAAVRNFIGCNMSLRRSVFAEVGGFSHGIGRIGKTPLGCEETELCIRLLQHFPAAQLMYDPRMRVVHRVTVDRVERRYFLRRCYSEGLSKALVSQLVGSSHALASERTYATRTLPLGILRGLADSILGGRQRGSRSSAVARSVAIVVGLCVTTTGYVTGKARIWRER